LSVPESWEETATDGGPFRQISAVDKATEQYLADLGVMDALPLKIIQCSKRSRDVEIEKLLEYVEEQNSPCVVVSSHGRTGVERMVLGSFAESLLKSSRAPIFFLNDLDNKIDRGQKMKRVLMATDFSNASRAAYLRFLSIAVSCGLDITLFHALSLPGGALMPGYGTAAPILIPENYYSDQTRAAKEEGERWAKIGQSQGVSVRLILKQESLGTGMSEAILSAAQEEGAALIVMASVSGVVSTFVLGSVTREVFRSHRFPVWVYGPKSFESPKGTSKNELKNVLF
jgi:nucleotide-binding universal stress UspA family protein